MPIKRKSSAVAGDPAGVETVLSILCTRGWYLFPEGVRVLQIGEFKSKFLQFVKYFSLCLNFAYFATLRFIILLSLFLCLLLSLF
jgi:uncharacterized membrane protein YfbV (UPF0208 family)